MDESLVTRGVLWGASTSSGITGTDTVYLVWSEVPEADHWLWSGGDALAQALGLPSGPGWLSRNNVEVWQGQGARQAVRLRHGDRFERLLPLRSGPDSLELSLEGRRGGAQLVWPGGPIWLAAAVQDGLHEPAYLALPCCCHIGLPSHLQAQLQQALPHAGRLLRVALELSEKAWFGHDALAQKDARCWLKDRVANDWCRPATTRGEA